MSATPGNLARLVVELQAGLALSGQGSYQRRLPAAAALPGIRNALKGLRALVQQLPTAEAWRALALAEESLLHYPAAVAALESAIALSNADRKDLKRLAQLREYAAKWEALGLTPASLRALGQHLASSLCNVPCDHSYRHTSAWLSANGLKAHAQIIQRLKSAGGYGDCEVLLNVV